MNLNTISKANNKQSQKKKKKKMKRKPHSQGAWKCHGGGGDGGVICFGLAWLVLGSSGSI